MKLRWYYLVPVLVLLLGFAGYVRFGGEELPDRDLAEIKARAWLAKHEIKGDVLEVYPTGSMAHELNENHWAVVKFCSIDEAKIGDIAVAQREGSWVPHDVIGLTSKGYLVTKGRAVARIDYGYVTPENFVGIVVHKERFR